MLPRVSPLTPTRCNPVALGHKPRESSSNLGPMGQISYFNCLERKVRGSAVRAPDLGPTSENCQCASQGVPLMPTRCNPVALGLKPRESSSNLGPMGQISYFNCLERKVRGSAVRAPDLGPTSENCQCASQGVPLMPTRCNPVALGLKPRESVSNLGPPGRISCFISNRNQSSGVRRSSPTSAQLAGSAKGVPSNTS